MRKLFSLLMIILSVLFICVGYFWPFQDLQNGSPEEIKILLKAGTFFEKMWTEGDIKKDWSNGKLVCPDLIGSPQNIGVEYTRCNPGYLECVFRDKNIYTLEDNKKIYKIKVHEQDKNQYSKIIAKSITKNPDHPYYSLLVTISLVDGSGKKINILLEDNCHETYLPRRLYAIGPDIFKGEDLDWRWDNLIRDIFVDKHLVTKRDYYEWKRLLMIGDSFPKNYNEVLASPITNIDISEMKRYCSFKGKHLLRAEIFDAASFFPPNLDDPLPLRNNRGPYPWSFRRDEGFLYQANMVDNFVFDPIFCQKVYVKNCIGKSPYYYFNQNNPSWIGINDTLGGYFEYLENVISPQKNLKASSMYFEVKSYWHQLGVRAYWNGEDPANRNNYDWLTQSGPDELSKLEIGFRCMRFL